MIQFFDSLVKVMVFPNVATCFFYAISWGYIFDKLCSKISTSITMKARYTAA